MAVSEAFVGREAMEFSGRKVTENMRLLRFHRESWKDQRFFVALRKLIALDLLRKFCGRDSKSIVVCWNGREVLVMVQQPNIERMSLRLAH